MTLTDEDHSMCRVATDWGIFCQGFRKLNDADLQKHFAGNEDLAGYCAGLLGQDVFVTPQGTFTPPASAG